MDKVNLVTFLDTVGRTIIGVPVKEDETFIYVKNPAVVNVVPQQDPNSQTVRMALQLFPLFFKEFLAATDEGTTWKFRRANITETDGELVFDFKLNIQYQQIFMNAPMQQAQPQAPVAPVVNNTPAIKLFDD